jgi:alkylation response protein AidB-like acyl-CoA dehydrogenase
MNFTITDEQYALKEVARNFANQELADNAAKWDRECIFPIDALKKSAELGMGGLYTSAQYGGSNLSRFESCLIFEELATACVATAAYMSIHNMVCWIIDTYANQFIKDKYLTKLTSFEYLSSYCLTEPDSGSDAASMKSTATIKDDYYLLNGSKCFISGGSVSDIYVCMVKTILENGTSGISCLLIEKGMPGLSFGEKEHKLGWNCQPTTNVYFQDCKVPKENLIGIEHNGFKIALEALNGGRVNIAACSLGGAKACLEQSRQYTRDRKQFGKSIDSFQALQFKLADMATNLQAAKLMTYNAACALDNKNQANNNDYIMYCAMAKQFTTDIAFDIANAAMQLHGGYGYLKDYPIERYFRDLRVHQILEGTNEIMRLVISRHLLNGVIIN